MSDVLKDLVASGSQTVGPFFHFGLTDGISGRMAESTAAGEHVRVKVRVTDGAGAPVFDAMVEVWQADPEGNYPVPAARDGKTPPPHFSGYGRQPTDANGECEFETVKPGRVADGQGGLQAPHLNVCLFARGLLRQLHTRIYFDGDSALVEDAALQRVPEGRRSTLVARSSGSGSGLWQFDIRMQGEQETVFSTYDVGPMGTRLIDSLGTTDALAAVFSDVSLLQSMLDVEAALARVQARLGIIPVSAADAIRTAAAAANFDAAAIARDARQSGTPVIPLVKALTSRVRYRDAGAARFVHFGATSQDISDTAFVLCLAQAHEIIQADGARLAAALRARSNEHAATVMLGRTLLQAAPPITFGLKAAGWYAAAERGRSRLAEAAARIAGLQFGGAAGTLASLGSRGLEVAGGLAAELSLTCPPAPWHAHRDRLADLVCACGVYTATIGKIARDVSLLMQVEVGEAAEPGGGSSTMPHKRNPSACAIALAAASRLPGLVSSFLTGMSQEHERGLGGLHAEWPVLADAMQATGAATVAMAGAMEGLTVDPARMRANIAATRGFVFAERAMMQLGAALGRDRAHELVSRAVEAATQGGTSLVDALGALPEVKAQMSAKDIAALDTPEEYLGAAEALRKALLGH